MQIPPLNHKTAGQSLATAVSGSDGSPFRRAMAPQGGIATALTVVAVVAGVALRWLHLGKQSLWWDEGFTAWASGLSPSYIVTFARLDNQPPFYYLLQHYWCSLFGTSEYALRASSAVFGTLSLFVFYFLAKKVLNHRLAVALAMWLFALSTKQLWYSQEARAYEAAVFFALVSLYALILFLRKHSGKLFLATVLFVTASVYMHTMMFFYLLALNVTWLIYPSERVWMQRVKEVLLADALVGVLYLPWAVTLLSQVGAVHGNLWWVPRPTVSTLIDTLRGLVGFDIHYLTVVATRFLPLSIQTARSCVIGGAVFLYAVVVVGGLLAVPKVDRKGYVSLLVYCLLPILLVFVLSQKVPLFIDRVFTASSVVVPLLLAYPLVSQRWPKGRMLFGLLGIIVAAAAALSAVGFVRYPEQKEDWRTATRTLLAIPERNRLIVFVPPAAEILFDYYSRSFPGMGSGVVRMSLPDSYHERFPPPKAKIVDSAEVNRLKLALESARYSEVDLVLAHGVDPHELLLKYLDAFFVRGRQQVYGPGVSFLVVRYALPR